MLAPPVWFKDAQATPVLELLRWFVTQLSRSGELTRQRPLARKLNKRTIPALFDHNALEEIDFLWEIIDELSSAPYCIWITSKEITSGKYRKENEIRLTLNYSSESTLRDWLNMPILDPREVEWRNSVRSSTLTHLPLHLLSEESYPGIYLPDELLTSLDAVNELIGKKCGTLTWRQLSAACFAGDSKYLDNFSRQQWLLRIFPELDVLIKPRRLLFDAHLVDNPQGILLVENQDTFSWLCTEGFNIPCVSRLHLVYSRGFQGSALRARTATYASFYFSGEFSLRERFLNDWFLSSEDHSLPVFFWGDLDYSGMGIIKALRQSFENLTAWEPGYAPLAEKVSSGGGHLPASTGKEFQLHPGNTGCWYADNYLLPLISEKQRFADQEMIFSVNLLQTQPNVFEKQNAF